MTFTYIGDLSTDLDEIRFTIQDTTENSGVKPSGGNFTDEEINGILTKEVTVGRAVARIYETLASSYANYVDTKIGSRDEKLSKISDHYHSLAKRWRENYGDGSGIMIQIGSFDEGISEDEPS